jgi:hypothetical protein
MRYHKPFTPEQRQDAIQVYRSLRAAFDTMRFEFPPSNRIQRRLVREYRQAVHDFARALSEKDAKVDAGHLNLIKARAESLCLDYAILWNGSGGRFPE